METYFGNVIDSHQPQNSINLANGMERSHYYETLFSVDKYSEIVNYEIKFGETAQYLYCQHLRGEHLFTFAKTASPHRPW